MANMDVLAVTHQEKLSQFLLREIRMFTSTMLITQMAMIMYEL
jgi:hypothetical protein